MPAWLLPDQIADSLPNEARKVELLRRSCLDTAHHYGYELVSPPLLEYTDSLLTGTGRDLDVRTFKLTDQLSGKTLGLRADITPQVARIDAHLLNREGVTRLCYAGAALHTRAANALSSRELLQFGAEMYGHATLEAETEILCLLLACLKQCQVQDITVDLGDVRVVEALLADQALSTENHDDLIEALQAKDETRIRDIAQRKQGNAQDVLNASTVEALVGLCHLWGDLSVLEAVAHQFSGNAKISKAVTELKQLAASIAKTYDVKFNVDFADLRGYHYYTAATFAIYVPGLQTSLARGGRYDAVGAAFGRERPAVGFSFDIKQLASLSHLSE
jgi:ATP phosphoribosyltransferase regulatory subunit